MTAAVQNSKPQENNGILETIVYGVAVRLSFSKAGSEEIPPLVREILKTAYLRCQAQ